MTFKHQNEKGARGDTQGRERPTSPSPPHEHAHEPPQRHPFLTALGEGLSEPILLMGETGVVLWGNQSAWRWLGVEPIHLLGRLLLSPATPRLTALQALSQGLASKPPQKTEKLLENGDLSQPVLGKGEQVLLREVSLAPNGARRFLVQVFGQSAASPPPPPAQPHDPAQAPQRKPSHVHYRSFGLSKRESQVARLAMDGLTQVRIAKRLRISPNTVHTHMKKIYKKLCISSRIELIRKLTGID